MHRDRLRTALGLLWILDGVLQLQPAMFSPTFLREQIGMAGMGLPHQVATMYGAFSTLLGGHPLVWELVLAASEIAVGTGIVVGRAPRLTLGASVVLGLVVWGVGEGFGGLFAPGTSMLTGAPGSALLYVVAAMALWTSGSGPTSGGRRQRSPVSGPLAAWVVLWLAGALLELTPANHASGVPAAQVAQGAAGAPAGLDALDGLVARGIGHHGLAFALVVAAVQVEVALFSLRPSTRKAALICGAAVACVYWVLGQGVGGLFTGQATDPGAGPLWVLLAAVVYRSDAGNGDVEPTRAVRSVRRPRSVPGPERDLAVVDVDPVPLRQPASGVDKRPGIEAGELGVVGMAEDHRIEAPREESLRSHMVGVLPVPATPVINLHLEARPSAIEILPCQQERPGQASPQLVRPGPARVKGLVEMAVLDADPRVPRQEVEERAHDDREVGYQVLEGDVVVPDDVVDTGALAMQSP